MDRIIKLSSLAPINISFQTTNPELRCKMLHNRFAGNALKKVDSLYQAGIEMNGQIVLCKGVNDGENWNGVFGSVGISADTAKCVSCAGRTVEVPERTLSNGHLLQKRMREK